MKDDQAAAVLDLMREIAARLARIEQKLVARDRQIASKVSPLRKEDRIALAALFPAILAYHKRPLIVFSAAQALEYVADDVSVMAALKPVLGCNAETAPRRLGKAFARASGFVFDDLLIERGPKERTGWCWHLRRI